eukprot:2479064-Pyramimonas_sp.AAC.1
MASRWEQVRRGRFSHEQGHCEKGAKEAEEEMGAGLERGESVGYEKEKEQWSRMMMRRHAASCCHRVP